MAKKASLQILTANHLLEGHSIFLGDDGWSSDHQTAKVAVTPEEAAGLEALGHAEEAANRVVGVYLVAVELGADGHPEPTHYREKMRVRARPSFWPDPVRQRATAANARSDEARHVSL